MTPRTLAALILLLLPLAAGCGERPGESADPATKLVAKQVLPPPLSSDKPTKSGKPSPVSSGTPGTCSSGYVALTFDDGPSPITPRFISYLSAHQVPATFFIVGSRMVYQVPVAQREQQAGFSIGNHTWSHADLPLLSDDAVAAQVRSTAALFRHSGIRATLLVRPPYGDINPRVENVLTRLHLHTFQWTIDSGDWLSGDPQTIAHRVITGIRRHGVNVVLMHDGLSGAVHGRVASAQTIGAVPLVVRWARQQGYCFTAPGQPGWSEILHGMSWRTPVAGHAGGTLARRAEPAGSGAGTAR